MSASDASTKLGVFLYIVAVTIINIIHIRMTTNQKQYPLSVPIFKSSWPPMKIYVYPASTYHTDDCLYPKNMPNQYTNETHYWFQRMLEPTVHRQFLESPIITDDPSKADMFFIPHYSRMCSGLDGGKRWKKIPQYCSEVGSFLQRYSNTDHVIMHSVPHYGDKPADNAVASDHAPIICLLDFKLSRLKQSPWTFSKSLLVPFITIKAQRDLSKRRNMSAFVAMSTSTKGLRANSANLRQEIEKHLNEVNDSKVVTIVRNDYASFKYAVDNLEEMMSSSELCVVPPGDAPSSKRFFDAINCLCVPYLLADYFMLPFEDIPVDYNDVMFQHSSRQVYKLAETMNDLVKNRHVIWEKRTKLEQIKKMFTWDYKNKPRDGEALWLLSWALYDKNRMLEPYKNNEMTGFDNDPEFAFVT